MFRAGWRATRANVVALFQRPQNHFAAVDGIRALSQMAVMLYHCFFLARLAAKPEYFQQVVQETPTWLNWVWTLDYSVDAFFVISGYLIGTLLFREHQRSGTIDLKRFYWRRYLRLTPAYFAFIGLYLVFNPKSQPTIWANFLYVNNFIPVKEVSIPWAWSLAVEEQFYLVFPALLLWFVLKGSHPLAKLLTLLVASQLLAFWVFYSDPKLWNTTPAEVYFNTEMFQHYYDRFYVNLYTRFGPFVSGALLAYMLAYHKPALEKLRAKPLLFNGISLLVLGFLAYAMGFNPYASDTSLAASRWHLIINRNLFGLALVWILFAAHGPAGILHPLKAVLDWKGWFPIAQLSYCMYLFHYLVVVGVMSLAMGNFIHFGLIGDGQIFPYHWMPVAYVAVVILTLIPAVILHLAVEKPFMQLRDVIARRRNPEQKKAASAAF